MCHCDVFKRKYFQWKFYVQTLNRIYHTCSLNNQNHNSILFSSQSPKIYSYVLVIIFNVPISSAFLKRCVSADNEIFFCRLQSHQFLSRFKFFYHYQTPTWKPWISRIWYRWLKNLEYHVSDLELGIWLFYFHKMHCKQNLYTKRTCFTSTSWSNDERLYDG